LLLEEALRTKLEETISFSPHAGCEPKTDLAQANIYLIVLDYENDTIKRLWFGAVNAGKLIAPYRSPPLRRAFFFARVTCLIQINIA
jgi:hypothetical protein